MDSWILRDWAARYSFKDFIFPCCNLSVEDTFEDVGSVVWLGAVVTCRFWQFADPAKSLVADVQPFCPLEEPGLLSLSKSPSPPQSPNVAPVCLDHPFFLAGFDDFS